MEEKYAQNFAGIVYALRLQRGWSLRIAARHAGMPHSRLAEIEAGKDSHTHKSFRPSYVTVVKLARAYDQPPGEFLALAGHQPGPELADAEWKLLGLYRQMDPSGRETLITTAEALVSKES